MNQEEATKELTWMRMLLYGAGAVAAFHLAYHRAALALLILLHFYCLASLMRTRTWRQAFYSGLVVGAGIYAPSLEFFHTIFGWSAAVLWLVLAFWHGLFLAVARACRIRFGMRWAVLLLPILWTGAEYFRSEVYHLRFSWLSAGFAFADSMLSAPFGALGVYGIGFLLMTLVGGVLLADRRKSLAAAGIAVAGAALLLPGDQSTEPKVHTNIRVAGFQLEFPTEGMVLAELDRLVTQEPEAELIVLSEYTFSGDVPEAIRVWCRSHRKHLIAGGRDEIDHDRFYNTAFVIGPTGETVFKQAKSVPIQFFQDGLPAPRQQVWESPWGRLGIGICYDLSYRQVMDEYVRLGAEALIVPTMDVEEWGREQHHLHARVAPMRAMEYGVPILRLASSGVSQLATPAGAVTASAPFPGQSRIIAGDLPLNGAGRIPIDGWLAPLCLWLSTALIVWLATESVLNRVPLLRLGNLLRRRVKCSVDFAVPHPPVFSSTMSCGAASRWPAGLTRT
jgi:apolipoprotein N-acyltransferase